MLQNITYWEQLKTLLILYFFILIKPVFNQGLACYKCMTTDPNNDDCQDPFSSLINPLQYNCQVDILIQIDFYLTCRCIYTTLPNNLHVPPCLSTCKTRKICNRRTPRIADAANVCRSAANVIINVDATTTIKSFFFNQKNNAKI